MGLPSNPQPVSVKPDLIRFGITFVLLAIALGLLTVTLDLDPPSGLGAVVMMCAAFYAIAKFIERHGRAPSPAEKRALLRGSWLVAMLLQLMALPLLPFDFGPGILAVIFVIAGLLTLAFLALAYSNWMIGRLLEGQEKRHQRLLAKRE